MRDALRRLARERGGQASLCPSEVARQLAAEAGEAHWRALMPVVRTAASTLALAGEVEVLQRGQPQSPDGPWHGPIRIRLARKPDPA